MNIGNGLLVLALLSAAAHAADSKTAVPGRLAEVESKAQDVMGANTSEGVSQGMQTVLEGGQDKGAVVISPTKKAAAQTTPRRPAATLSPAVKPEPVPGSAVRDTTKEEQKPKDDELMKNLKKDAIGGAYGAVGFGILGFLFGGPVGALIGALIGFAVMGAVIHLNNN
ncbi:MAG TPA: hypothetical protein DCM05_15080 [Elusimicrobia bacterium]|nr:hypothetical protein [Elusimicrobiota bacterium]